MKDALQQKKNDAIQAKDDKPFPNLNIPLREMERIGKL
jgi:hypothetical protein